MNWARLLADVIVVFHATYVSFNVFGLAVILLGIAFRWDWVRNIWFRSIHLLTIGIVVGESLVGIPCPLTVWEARLRTAAGQTGYTGDFIGQLVHQVIFFRPHPRLFALIYTLFGLAVLVVFIVALPRLSRRSDPAGKVAAAKSS